MEPYKAKSMPLDYKIDKDMLKKDLRAMIGVSTTTMARLSKGENVSTEVLAKICSALKCDIGDIMEFIPDEEEDKGEV